MIPAVHVRLLQLKLKFKNVHDGIIVKIIIYMLSDSGNNTFLRYKHMHTIVIWQKCLDVFKTLSVQARTISNNDFYTKLKHDRLP